MQIIENEQLRLQYDRTRNILLIDNVPYECTPFCFTAMMGRFLFPDSLRDGKPTDVLTDLGRLEHFLNYFNNLPVIEQVL